MCSCRLFESLCVVLSVFFAVVVAVCCDRVFGVECVCGLLLVPYVKFFFFCARFCKLVCVCFVYDVSCGVVCVVCVCLSLCMLLFGF